MPHFAAYSQYEDIYLGSLSLSMMEDIHRHTYEILLTMYDLKAL